jgi:hypothetical protein
MTQPHVYLSHDLVIEATPVSKDEFEELTGAKSLKSAREVIFLKDVTILGHHGTIIEVAFFMLNTAAVSGVGKANIRRPASEQGKAPAHV